MEKLEKNTPLVISDFYVLSKENKIVSQSNDFHANFQKMLEKLKKHR